MQTFGPNLGMKGSDFTTRLHKNLNQMDLQMFWPYQNFPFFTSSHGNSIKGVLACRNPNPIAHTWQNITKIPANFVLDKSEKIELFLDLLPASLNFDVCYF